MNCKKCGEKIENISRKKFYFSLIMFLLLFCGFVLYAPVEVLFFGGVLVIVSILQLDNVLFIGKGKSICRKCLKPSAN